MKATVAVVIVLLASVSLAAEVRKDIPDAVWEPIYFEHIDKVTAKAGVAALREETLDKNELQLLLWAGLA